MDLKNVSFSGRTAVVTGGAQGIGQAIAAQLAEMGARVSILDVNAEKARQTCEEIGHGCGFYAVNLADGDAVVETMERLIRDKGRVDILINNAGIVNTSDFSELSRADWDRVLAVDLTAVFLTCQTVFRHMAASGDKYTLKMHLSAGTTDPIYEAATKFADEVSQKTNGNVTIELYPSSSLGNTADCLEGLSLRACDIVFDSFANLASRTDLANIDAAPYLYNDIDHYKAVWEGDVGAKILKAVGDDCGMTLMGAGLQGVRVLTTNKPVNTPADVKGMKLRVPTISIYLDTWSWLGATPTPLGASEIFTAIQQGTVDGQENPYGSCVGLSLYECCKYVTETNHVYSTDSFIMDTNSFNSLPADYQTAIQEAATDAGKFCTQNTVDSAAEKKQVFVDAGCTILTTDISQWQAALDGFLNEKYPMLVEYSDMIAAAKPAA